MLFPRAFALFVTLPLPPFTNASIGIDNRILLVYLKDARKGHSMEKLPELAVLFHRFAIALALGMIIGVEREREKSEAFAGIRTFPLISMLGCAAAMVNDLFAPWVFAAALIVLAAAAIAASSHGAPLRSYGITTEVASLLCFFYGGLVWWEASALAAALAVVTVLLLTSKELLEGVTQRIGHQDITAALQFGIITLIVLPILPDKPYGPLQVLNPHTIWLMVVLIAGINFIGYVLVKALGPQRGIGLTGLLGGIASSTALTASFSRKSRIQPERAPEFALAIVLACAVMFLRVLVEAAAVKPALGKILLLPIAASGCTGLLGCIGVWLVRRHAAYLSESQEVKTSNPFELWSALLFGVLFACILFIAKAAQVYFGTGGVYLSSIAAGIADVDPITLSLANLANAGISMQVAARGIILAAIANTVVKMAIMCTGVPSLLKYGFPLLSAMAAVGLLVSFTVL
ncbi:MAG: MgtC/SapB family protein [Desulfobacterota bacterium]|nr:MgtC/SapB family protein [Thermodesulfobacteriota bacterium]